MKLHIEEPIKESIFHHGLRFDKQYGEAKQWIAFRRDNLKTTQIFWITLSPVIDIGLTFYNPKCHIMLILN